MPSAPNADSRCVLIVGASTSVSRSACKCAMHGFEVVVYDIAPDALEAAEAQIKAYAAQLVNHIRFTASGSDAAFGSIHFAANPADERRSGPGQ